jgi:2-polyprenyl-3-methyl-5-hydroxy-6-metoxy-1,4-benzoquinol methylase
MDAEKLALTKAKYRLPNHWLRDPLHKYGLPYFGYMQLAISCLPPAPAHVLDAGCGDGRIASEMIQHGYTLTGVDILDTSVYYAQQLVPEGTFFQADLRLPPEQYGFQTNQFDAIVMMEVYEHIPPETCQIVLQHLHQILKENGRFIISVPSKLQPPSQLHYRHFDPEDLTRELVIAGFQVQKFIGQNQLNRLSGILMNDKVERLLDNQWLQPVFLKRLRRFWYSRYANISPISQSQRYIAVATKASIVA